MNFCPKCGTAVKAPAHFCPSCGFDLSTAGESGAADTAQTVTQSEQTAPVNNEPVATPVTPTPMRSQATTANAAPDAPIDYQSNLGLIGAMKQYFQNYVNFNGRMSRANFWWAYLGYMIIDVVVLIIDLSINSNALMWLFTLVFAVPSLTSFSRRLHDSNYSFTNYFWALLPVIGWIYLIILLCKPGDTEANRFG